MNEYLICDSFHYARIYKKAWDYLVSIITKDMSSDDYRSEHETYSSIWNKYFKDFGRKKEDGESESIEFSSYTEESYDFREILCNMVKELHYDYQKFDELNEGVLLRIVLAPDDGHKYVIMSGEYCEYLTQSGKNIFVKNDWEMRANYIISNFCYTHEDLEKTTYVVELENVRIVFDEEYGLAEVKNPKNEFVYYILKKNEYFKATKEHPKICFEIYKNDGEFRNEYIPSSMMKTLTNLFERLK